MPEERSWRPEPSRTGARWRWWTARLLLTGLAVGLVGLLFVVMRRPFEHPRPKWVVIGMPGETWPTTSRERLPFPGFPAEDAAGLATVARGIDADETVVEIQPPRNGRVAELFSSRVTTANRDVLLVQITAQGISVDGRAMLAWTNRDDGRAVRTPLAELLDAIRAQPARTKVVLLDAGRVTSLVEEGTVANGFPQLVRSELREGPRDPSIWVLMSHSPLETSRVSYAERRSIFAESVAAGLAGDADANGDRTVDLAELYDYVAHGVGERVATLSSDTRSQTPQLLWAGGDSLEDAPRPVLVPIPENESEAATDEAKSDADGAGDDSKSAKSPNKDGKPDAKSDTPAVPDAASKKATEPPNAGAPQPGGGAKPESPAASPPDRGPAPTGTPGESPATADASTSTSATDPTTAEAGSSVSSDPAQKPGGTSGADTVAATEALVGSLDPLERLLFEAWSLRDELRGGDDRPLDRSPVAWRALERLLLDHEQRLRAGLGDEATARRSLESVIAGFQSLAEARPIAVDIPIPNGVHSLAMLEALARVGRGPSPAETATIEAFDTALLAGPPDALRKVLADGRGRVTESVEWRLANELSSRGVRWAKLSRTVRARRRVESLAASGEAVWTGPTILQADERLRRAERVLADGVRPGSDLVDRLLGETTVLCERAERVRDDVREARRVRNDVASRLADHVDGWFESAHGRTAGSDDLRSLVGALRELERQLASHDPAKIVALDRAATAADTVQRRIGRSLQPEYVQLLVDTETATGNRAELEAILATPLAPAISRLTAIRALRRIGDHAPSNTDGGRDGIVETTRVRPDAVRANWRPYVLRAELERAITKLAEPAEESPASKQLDERLDELLELDHANGNAVVGHEQWWRAVGRFGRALHTANDRQRARLLADLDGAAGPVVDWSRLVRFVPPADRKNTVDVDARLVARADRHAIEALLDLQSRRMRAVPPDATMPDIEFANRFADLYSGLLATLRSTEPGRVEPFPLRVDAPQRVIATPSNGGEFVARLEWRGTAATRIRVLVESQPDTVEVTSSDGVLLEAWADVERAGGEYPYWPTIEERPPAFEVHPGAAAEVRLRVRPIAAGGVFVPFVVRFVADGAYVRHRVEVGDPPRLPVAVDFEGPRRAVEQTAARAELHPFPNRATPFALQLTSSDGAEHTVDAELRALASPLTVTVGEFALTKPELDRLLSSLGPNERIGTAAKVVLPANGEPVAAALAATSATPTAPPMGGAEPPPGRPFSGDLVLVLREPATGLAAVRPVVVRPQHPRRFVKPAVTYDATSRRLAVAFGPAGESDNVFPPGRLAILATTDPPLPEGTPRRFSLEFDPRDPKAALERVTARLPPEVNAPLHLFLDVDGFPRTFVYRIDPSRSDDAVPEDDGFARARIDSPEPRTAFPKDTRNVSVGIEFDAPRATASTMSVGFDLNGDRDLVDEPTVDLATDRMVSLRVEVDADGRLILHTGVRDHVVSMAVPRTNVVLPLLARVRSPRGTVFGDAVPVVFDARPPRLPSVTRAPARREVVIGAPLVVRCVGSDDGLSGVRTIEAAFDVDGSGEIAKDAELFPAKRGDGETWTIEVPTMPLSSGPQTLLVRATDAVGNVAKPIPLSFVAVTEADRMAELAMKKRPLAGLVTYLGKPVPNAIVRLDMEMGKPIPPVRTDERGRFVFADRLPGRYLVSARALVKNRNREDEVEIEIKPPPVPVPFVELELPFRRD